MNSAPAIEVAELSHAYRERQALRSVSFEIAAGEIFAFLGPNGGGKSTLFRVLSTLMPPQQGHVNILGQSVVEKQLAVRETIGVVFQAPSLDKKLTVDENLSQQAALYGLHGDQLTQRREEVLQQLGLVDRRSDLTETLSGGLRRRVDLAKGLLHRPRLLLLDEPSTGLDPGARSDLWRYLQQLRDDFGVTIVLTSHLLEEADRADRVAVLHLGQIVAQGTPAELRESVGGDSISIECERPAELAAKINQQFGFQVSVVDDVIRFPCSDGAVGVAQVMQEYSDEVHSIKLGKPTLEDVFIAKTGHRFWQAEDAAVAS